MKIDVYNWHVNSYSSSDAEEKLTRTIKEAYSGDYGEVISMNVTPLINIDKVFPYQYSIIFITKSIYNNE